jgi:hypothetical protein
MKAVWSYVIALAFKPELSSRDEFLVLVDVESRSFAPELPQAESTSTPTVTSARLSLVDFRM